MRRLRQAFLPRAALISCILSALSSPAAAQNAAIAITSNLGHSKEVTAVALSPDGRLLVSGSEDNTVKVWHIAAGRLLRTLSGHTDKIYAVAVSPDSSLIVSAGADGSVNIYDALGGRLLRTIKTRSYSLAFSPDGKWLLVASKSAVIAFDPLSGRALRKFAPPLNRKDPLDFVLVDSFALSLDGSRLATAGYTTLFVSRDVTVKVWDTRSGRLLQTLPHSESVHSMAFSPDGRSLVSFQSAYHSAGLIRMWDLNTGTVRFTIKQGEIYRQVVFAADGKWFSTIGQYGGALIWDALTGNHVGTFYGATGGALALSKDGSRLAAHFERDNFAVWNTRDRQRVQTFPNTEPVIGIESIGTPKDGGWVAAADKMKLSKWDLTTGQLARRLTGGIYADRIAVAPDGRWIAQPGYSQILLFNSVSGGIVSELRINRTRSQVAFPDSRWLATGEDDKINISDVTSGQVVRTIDAHAGEILALSLSGDGARLASAGEDKTVKVWDTANGRLVSSTRQSTERIGPAYAVSVSPDGRLLVTGEGFNSLVKLWQTETGQPVRTMAGHPSGTFVVRFSPDGSQIASGGRDNLIKIWSTANGQMLRTLAGHGSEITGLQFTAGGQRVVSSSKDGTIKVWRADTGDILATFVTVGESEWLTITPEGYFAGTEKGARLLHAVRGLDVFGIDQVYQSLYRPDLVREKLAGDPRGLVRQAAAQLDLGKVLMSGPAPGVRVVSPDDRTSTASQQITADIELTDRGGGIGRVEWRVNGLTVGIETSPARPAAGQPLRLTRNLLLDEGENTIEIVAYNNANLIASDPAHFTIDAPATAPVPGPTNTGPNPVAAPRLFVLAAGLDNYADKRFRLQYSVPDAKAMAQAFEDSGKGLYQSVEVKVMSDAEVVTDGLNAAFRDLSKKIQPTDVFVLYLAGHGKTVDGRYYFVPQDFKVGGDLAGPVVDTAVKAQGIAQEQWQRWFATIPARKSVILFDTCESGTLTGNARETKSLERGAANDRLAQATGRSIITASSASEEAFEGYRGHGLFTYNLLDALDKGDGDSNGTIEVTELAAYVYAQVTAISEKVFKQRQEPQMNVTLNYPLTRQARVLVDDSPAIAMETKPTYQLSQTASLQIKPSSGATVVRSLSPKTAVTVLKSEDGWSLIASGGKPIGYVATRDLAPIQ